MDPNKPTAEQRTTSSYTLEAQERQAASERATEINRTLNKCDELLDAAGVLVDEPDLGLRVANLLDQLNIVKHERDHLLGHSVAATAPVMTATEFNRRLEAVEAWLQKLSTHIHHEHQPGSTGVPVYMTAAERFPAQQP